MPILAFARLLMALPIIWLFPGAAFSQVTAEQTGVAIEALQHNFDEYMSFSYSQGLLCQKTLKQVVPGLRGQPENSDIAINFAGIITSKWKQIVMGTNGKAPKVWDFECVCQVRAGQRLVVLSLVMYEQHGAERRGVELVTNRDVHVIHEPR